MSSNGNIIRGWDNLPQFSKDMYKERYFAKNETYEDWAKEIAKKYIDKIEEITNVKVGIISTSPERDDTIIRG